MLFVDNISEEEETELKNSFRNLRSANDKFTYSITIQRSFQDAMIALHINHNIQAVVVRYAPPYYSKTITPLLKPYIQPALKLDYSSKPDDDLGPLIGSLMNQFRPELDAYYVTDTALAHLKNSTLKSFRRIFYQTEDIQELHLTIVRGVEDRYETPFFSALVQYSQKPTGVFHAMPISRGNSVFKSRWINDFGDFYGRNMFLAETSATTGGLDSLLQPTGPIKKAQEMARDAYGSQNTYFVTNGTSTANKIVMQALVQPGDVVLIDRDCHKSHHYGLVLSGAYPVYLDSYPIEEYSMYGAVPLKQIKDKLLKLKEAYMTHTSTSPNYQMLASLDVGRRQVQLEGFEMVEKSIELAMVLRAKINNTPQLSKYFDILTVRNFIPDVYRTSGLKEYYTREEGWNAMEDAWENDEFVLDPTKVTLYIGKTGVDGDTFKNKYLMDKFSIQINKTSRNTVLFMTNIGTTRGSVTYLTNALLRIADELDEEFKSLNSKEIEILNKRIHSLTKEVPPLPDFSYFHLSFQAVPGVPGGNIRSAYFLAYDEENCEYVPLENCLSVMEGGKTLVASTFVISYPPGFPVLVPGQVVSEEIINFLTALDVSEIHGYRAELGLRVFKQNVLNRHKAVSSLGAMGAANPIKK